MAFLLEAMAWFGLALISTASNEDTAAAFWVGMLGDATMIALYVSVLPTLKIIWDNGSVGNDDSPYPFAAALFNCCVWFGYACGIKNGGSILGINGGGAILEFLYVVLFLCYIDDQDEYDNLVVVLVLEMLLFGVVAAIGIGLWPAVFGYVGTGSGMLMYASPVPNTYRAYNNQTTEGMDPYMYVGMLANAGTWFIYAVITVDYYMGATNGVGFLCAGAQLLMYIKIKHHYGDHA